MRAQAAVTHFRRATIRVQSIWRMQVLRSAHHCRQLSLAWDIVWTKMVDDLAQRILEQEVAALAPENNKINEINKVNTLLLEIQLGYSPMY